MSEILASKVVRASLAVVATAGSLCVSGCTGANSEKIPSTPANYKKIGTEFKKNLGVRVFDKVRYFGSLGLSADRLTDDLDSRSETLPTEQYDPELVSEGVQTPQNIDEEYSSPQRADQGVDEEILDDNFISPMVEWTIDLKDETDFNEEFLPIARVENSNSTTSLRLSDTRPPLGRIETEENKASNSNYQNLKEQVIEPSSELLKTAFEKNHLKKIEFVYDSYSAKDEKKFGAESSYYNPQTKDVVIVLNKTGNTSNQELKSTLIHEVGHNLFSKHPASEINSKIAQKPTLIQLQNACSKLKEQSFKEVGDKSWEKLIPIFRKLSSEKHVSKESISYIVSAIESGNYDKLQYSSKNDDESDNNISECSLTTPTQAIGLVKQNIVEDTSKLSGGISKRSIKLMDRLNEEFSDIYRSTELMKTISEHGYIADNLAGHPEDNIDEMAASIFALSLTRPNQFKASINALPQAETKAVENAYRLIRRVFVKSYPELNEIMIKI